MNQAWSLASAFITSCPPNNPTIFATVFPSLIASTTYTAGESITLQFNASATGAAELNSTNPPYLSFLTGLGSLTAPVTSIGGNLWTAELPAALESRGTVYGIITNSNTSTADANTVAGVLVLQFPYNSSVTQGL